MRGETVRFILMDHANWVVGYGDIDGIFFYFCSYFTSFKEIEIFCKVNMISFTRKLNLFADFTGRHISFMCLFLQRLIRFCDLTSVVSCFGRSKCLSISYLYFSLCVNCRGLLYLFFWFRLFSDFGETFY